MIRLVFNKEQFFPSCVLTSVMVAMIQLKSGVNQIETRHESDRPPFLHWQSFCISAKCPDKGGLIVNAGWQIERLEPVCVWWVCWWCGERERGALTLVNQSHPHQLVHQEANEEGQHEKWQQDHLGTEAPSMSRGEITWATG